MKNTFKIKRDEFKVALRSILMTESDFAKLVGVKRGHLNSLSSKNPKNRGSVSLCKRILKAFGDKYKFDDIFFWVD